MNVPQGTVLPFLHGEFLLKLMDILLVGGTKNTPLHQLCCKRRLFVERKRSLLKAQSLIRQVIVGYANQDVWYRNENYLCNVKTKARTEDFLNVGTKPLEKSVVVLCDQVYCPKPSFRADPCSGIWCSEDSHKWPVESGVVVRIAWCQRLIWSAKRLCSLARCAEPCK